MKFLLSAEWVIFLSVMGVLVTIYLAMEVVLFITLREASSEVSHGDNFYYVFKRIRLAWSFEEVLFNH